MTNDDIYLTIKAPSEAVFKDKGSKFMAFAYPVSSEADIKLYLDALRKKYFDATHHCYAYILGPDKAVSRANDDGEPAHSAGTPILSQLRSLQITDTLIVVVRYYGGTKLGVSGLINAYKTSAYEALTVAGIIEKILMNDLAIKFDYLAMNEIMKLIKDNNIKITNQQFDNTCYLQLSIRQSIYNQFVEKIKKVESLVLVF